jgi:hypothetical protein
MTHVDPFAPAGSPQHPSNFEPGHVAEYVTVPNVAEDLAPRWIAIIGDPISSDTSVCPNPDDIADQRWEEYEQLLRELGEPEQVEYLDRPTSDWPEGMPTLVELRDRVQQATGLDAQEAAQLALAEKLKELDEAGL